MITKYLLLLKIALHKYKVLTLQLQAASETGLLGRFMILGYFPIFNRGTSDSGKKSKIICEFEFESC